MIMKNWRHQHTKKKQLNDNVTLLYYNNYDYDIPLDLPNTPILKLIHSSIFLIKSSLLNREKKYFLIKLKIIMLQNI